MAGVTGSSSYQSMEGRHPLFIHKRKQQRRSPLLLPTLTSCRLVATRLLKAAVHMDRPRFYKTNQEVQNYSGKTRLVPIQPVSL